MSAESPKIVVIGGGIFGCTTALALAEAGFEVVLFERREDILLGTTKNNTNRVHQGFHYPRDLNTARMCQQNFRRFEETLAPAIVRGFPNIYCIAKDQSITSVDQYLNFCKQMGFEYKKIDFQTYATTVRECSLGLEVQETVCDTEILRVLLKGKLQANKNIELVCGTEILSISRSNRDYSLTLENKSKIRANAVVNCSYADINRLTLQLGHTVSKHQFEYTVVPIIELNLPPQGITVMDGPFITLLPYGNTGKFTLYHVNHSVIETQIKEAMDVRWLDSNLAPFASRHKPTFFETMIEASSFFVPDLKTAKLAGFLEGPRMVLPNHEKDDARPSVLKNYGDGYLTVFSGKIDHFFSIAESVCAAYQQYFEMPQKSHSLEPHGFR